MSTSNARKRSALTGEVSAQLREVRRLARDLAAQQPGLVLEFAVAIDTALERATAGDVLRVVRKGLAEGLDQAGPCDEEDET